MKHLKKYLQRGKQNGSFRFITDNFAKWCEAEGYYTPPRLETFELIVDTNLSRVHASDMIGCGVYIADGIQV